MRLRPHFLQPLLSASASGLGLYVHGRTEPIAATLVGAFDSAARRRGLLGRASMPAGEALVIAPCQAVHTFRMRFDIDVVYAARDGRVVKLRERLKPGRLSGAWSAFAVIEMAAGAVARHTLEPGLRLEVR
jgi:hypothetical protein